MGRPAKFLSKDDVLRAMTKTRSNAAAARYLGCSYNHYKKFARTYTDENGTPLLEVHKNQSGRGIPKFLSNKGKEPALLDILEGRTPIEHFTPARIKQRIIQEVILPEECTKCGFNERRVQDFKVPLVLNHKDGDKKNFSVSNIEFLCYNCSFLYAISPITDEQVNAQEDYVKGNTKEFDWEIDDATLEHFRELGLVQEKEEYTPGSEFISRK